MTDNCCDHCGAVLEPVTAVQAIVSTGFGAGNDRTRSFCDRVCRAKWRDSEVDVVLVRTRQTTLAAFDSDVSDPSQQIVWSH
ncbi:hypothetical protein HYG81_06200 [Natrinema zhouii]|uniref:Uncharacterized protein n=1 Tax=Natrinema zhouii TaxID=1710539 RepID=A0A7D6CPW9_9EURY|nr:hypothetical protein [Natrinema zhouii]QLK27192.1 hypothetical protein HYG81_06200 [Natrinema zhouii]